MKQNDAPTCIQCNERPAMLRKNGKLVNGLCARCWQQGIKGKAARVREQMLHVRFDSVPGLLDELAAAAAEECRTVEHQALYYIRRCLRVRDCGDADAHR